MMHASTICARTGCGKPILKRIRESRSQYAARRYCGSECRRSHESERKVRRVKDMAEMRRRGMSTAEIAEQVGLGAKQVSRLARSVDVVKGNETVDGIKNARAVMDSPPGWHAAALRCLPECEIALMKKMKEEEDERRRRALVHRDSRCGS